MELGQRWMRWMSYSSSMARKKAEKVGTKPAMKKLAKMTVSFSRGARGNIVGRTMVSRAGGLRPAGMHASRTLSSPSWLRRRDRGGRRAHRSRWPQPGHSSSSSAMTSSDPWRRCESKEKWNWRRSKGKARRRRRQGMKIRKEVNRFSV